MHSEQGEREIKKDYDSKGVYLSSQVCGPDVSSAAVLGNILCNKYSSDEMLCNLPLPEPAVSFHFIGKIVIYLLCQSNGMHWESVSDESVSNAS